MLLQATWTKPLGIQRQSLTASLDATVVHRSQQELSSQDGQEVRMYSKTLSNLTPL
jgi:hypothetical protein